MFEKRWSDKLKLILLFQLSVSIFIYLIRDRYWKIHKSNLKIYELR